jgi:hypothetical protein
MSSNKKKLQLGSKSEDVGGVGGDGSGVIRGASSNESLATLSTKGLSIQCAANICRINSNFHN